VNAPVGARTPAGAFRLRRGYDLAVGGVEQRASLRRAPLAGVVALALWAGAAAVLAQDAEGEWPPGVFTATLGAEYSSGDYDEERITRIRSASLGLRYARGPWTARVFVPYLYVGGPGNVVGGTETVVVGDSAGPLQHERGLGDVVAAVSYAIDPADRRLPLVELIAKVKFGTASESRNLGTGANDYTLLVDVSKTFDRFTPFVTLGHRWVGNASGFDLRDSWRASGGLAMRLSERLSGGIVYDYREASSSDSGDSHEIGPYASYRLTSHWKLGAYGFFGLSAAAADFGLGTTLSYRW
jgi:hypothetical protein